MRDKVMSDFLNILLKCCKIFSTQRDASAKLDPNCEAVEGHARLACLCLGLVDIFGCLGGPLGLAKTPCSPVA